MYEDGEEDYQIWGQVIELDPIEFHQGLEKRGHEEVYPTGQVVEEDHRRRVSIDRRIPNGQDDEL